LDFLKDRSEIQPMTIQVKIANTADELKTVYRIRKSVFIDEQHIPARIEIDEFENDSVHILAAKDNQPVGTARWRDTTVGRKLERFAVLKQYRGFGVGKALVEFCLKENQSNSKIYLNAQKSVIEFYRKLGFVAVGEFFTEANIPHRTMEYHPD